MEPIKSKMKGMLWPANENSLGGRGSIKVQDLEIRPGGMLVQKRSSSDSNQYSVPIPTIKVKVKYGSSSHQICINSQASFGELKKMLAGHTGLHHQDQKLIYKKKERDSKSFLDIAGVKDGSKIILIEDTTSRQRRCLEKLKSAKTEKASKSLQQISLEVDKLSANVAALEETNARGEKVAEVDIDNLTEILMNTLVALDGIAAEGELKLQKGMQERRVQKFIETLDILKLQNSKNKRNEDKISMQTQENSTGKMPIPLQKQQHQLQLLRHSESVVITTKWETFD